jgi:hypothetical protein
MLQGASLKISPTWVKETTIIDIQWDTDSLGNYTPTGLWWGELALLAGTGQQNGEWEWMPASLELELWVPVPGNVAHRRLIATLFDFAFPVTTGMSGEGKLQPGLVPTTQAPTFGWEGFAFTVTAQWVKPSYGEQKQAVTAIAPWKPVAAVDASAAGIVVRDELHTRFRLPRDPVVAVRLPELILFNPTNTGTCPCAIFLASLNQAGHPLEVIDLSPGESRDLYEAPRGAVSIAAACSRGCTFPNCFSELTIDNPVA